MPCLITISAGLIQLCNGLSPDGCSRLLTQTIPEHHGKVRNENYLAAPFGGSTLFSLLVPQTLAYQSPHSDRAGWAGPAAFWKLGKLTVTVLTA